MSGLGAGINEILHIKEALVKLMRLARSSFGK